MKRLLPVMFLQCCLVLGNTSGRTQNPIIQTVYTADPAPLVHHDTLYLYTGHDEDSSTWFTMRDWRVYATTDMVNWTDRGVGLSLKTFGWATQDAWAGQCIERNGKFYWYVPMKTKKEGMSIGVAVSDHATGPFTDALGHPLVHSGNGDIDPTAFIDTDGQAYLYWGNPYLKYIKLNADMISYSGAVNTVQLDSTGFHVRYKERDKRPSAYEEGPWLYKRDKRYYMLYAAGGVPEHLAYSTSSSATGPWQYRDTLMTIIRKGGAFTNHPGLVDYKGKSYLFYHNGALPGGGGFTRSVCVDEVSFNKDGSIKRVIPTSQAIINPVGSINPFKRVEAETIAWEKGIETKLDSLNGVYVTDIHGGDYIKIRQVSFKQSPKSFEAKVRGLQGGGSIDIRLDSLQGRSIGQLLVPASDKNMKWTLVKCKTANVKGTYDLFFVFTGTGKELFDFDSWMFK